MIGIIGNRYVNLKLDRIMLISKQSAQPPAEPVAPLVQYHVKGEFKPVDIVISSTATPKSEVTISQILLPVTEEPLHETTKIAKVVEVSAPPVQVITTKEKEPEAQYSTWDASK